MRDRAEEGSARRGDGRAGGRVDGPVVLRVSGAISATPGAAPAPEGAGPGSATGGPVLVLTSPSGAMFHLPVDGSLRAALRQATAAPVATDAPEPPLRPKDIQTRIRAGESARELAEAAGVPLEHVERYAGPVLAERAHVAGVARATVVRSARTRPSLEDLVRHRLASRGVALTSVTWDAWRRGEAGWALQVSFRAGTRDRLAQWSYDPGGESVEPLDDEARWLSASHEAEGPGSTGRLSAVRVFDVETDGGVREVPGDQPLLGGTGPLPASATGGATGPATGSATGPTTGRVPGQSREPGGGPDARSARYDPGHDPGTLPRDGAAALGGDDDAPWAGPDHDEVAARTMDLLDALSDRRGRRQPMQDLGADGGWDEEDLDDDLVDALLDLPPAAHPAGSRAGEGAEDGAEHDGGHPSLGAGPRAARGGEPRLRAVPAPTSWGEAPAGDDATGPDPQDGDGPLRPASPTRGPVLLGLVPSLAPPAPGSSEPWTGEAPRAGAAAPERPAAERPGQVDTAGPGDTGELVETGELAPAAGARPSSEPERPAARSRTRRASVPSWDEIVFGSPRTED